MEDEFFKIEETAEEVRETLREIIKGRYSWGPKTIFGVEYEDIRRKCPEKYKMISKLYHFKNEEIEIKFSPEVLERKEKAYREKVVEFALIQGEIESIETENERLKREYRQIFEERGEAQIEEAKKWVAEQDIKGKKNQDRANLTEKQQIKWLKRLEERYGFVSSLIRPRKLSENIGSAVTEKP